MTVNTEQESWWRFLKLCTKLKTTKQLNALFDLFLTNAERKAVAFRYEIIRELIKNERTQREIAAKFHVSIAKITRGSNYLKIISQDLRKLLEGELK